MTGRALLLWLLVPVGAAGCDQTDVVATQRPVDAGPVDSGEVSRDGDAPDAGPPNVVFQDDFETCDYRRWTTGPGARGRVDNPGRESLCASVHAESASSVDGFSPMSADVGPLDELWVRVWMRFAVELRIEGRGIEMVRVDQGSDVGAASMRIPIGSERVGVTNVAAPDAEALMSLGTLDPSGPGNLERWICYELHVRMNAPGDTNGRVAAYADGLLLTEVEGDIRGNNPSLSLDRVRILPRFPGAGAWPMPTSIRVDDVLVTRTRVPCG